MSKKKVFAAAQDAILHATYRAVTRKTLQLIYKGLCLFSRSEAEKRREQEAADKK